ncbi:polyketide synthase dehydratase domain-containing protein, partial [Streptomyces aculeolatus]|uniref:polyketide synthase dehydratase domain-containing protein n=1 Tax=Streptomyces aculeolatus TaxID=270689 RepID=UPI0027DEFE44
MAGEDEWLLTGRLSAAAHPWLMDHVVAGKAVVPGTALLEVVVRAADQVGCDEIEELTLQAPLLLPEHDVVQLQVRVGAEDVHGRRETKIYSRLDDREMDIDHPWTCHAVATVVTGDPDQTVAVGSVGWGG